ncbi:nucleotidyltransferase family protein [Paenibacillus swuensis]|uniref:nucleotidyltransferase family protein n=1 Tax=Paenibacillus swuensis TaxID=1178515 RepID=UPI000839AA3B|nr:NTP transferase domain-containing protein [Paenibacillus swuensis]
MGRHKLSLELSPGISLGANSLRQMMRIELLDSICVVVNPRHATAWLPDLKNSKETQYTVISCADAHKGLSYSLRFGLEHLRALPHSQDAPDAIMVLLADQPFVTEAMLKRLIYHWRNQPGLDYVASSFNDVVMPPVLLGGSMFEAAHQLKGDQGAKALFTESAFQGLFVKETSPYSLLDVDEPSEFTKAKDYWQQNYNKHRF